MWLPMLLLLSAGVAAGANGWVRVSSANFELYSNASDKEAQRTLEYFEQVRDFFMRSRPGEDRNALPVTIVAFRNQKDYKPYAVRESAQRLRGDESRDYIVLEAWGEIFPVAA
ncbi:MAG: hypothetical protein WKF37_09360 [Bryobacteraceae bacterium]